MPKLNVTATTTTTTEVELTTRQKHALMVKFQSYAAQKRVLDAAQAKLDVLKVDIQKLREATGELSLELNGFQSTLVAPTRKVFDPKTFVRLGGDLDVYNESMKDTPVKAYEKITYPKGDA